MLTLWWFIEIPEVCVFAKLADRMKPGFQGAVDEPPFRIKSVTCNVPRQGNGEMFLFKGLYMIYGEVNGVFFRIVKRRGDLFDTQGIGGIVCFIDRGNGGNFEHFHGTVLYAVPEVAMIIGCFATFWNERSGYWQEIVVPGIIYAFD